MALVRPVEISSLFRLSVVSHDEKLLKQVGDRPFIRKFLLSELEIPAKYRGENLAESRFLVGDFLVQGHYRFQGFASARWNERFPSWPKLENLDEAISQLGEDSHSRLFFAPISFKLRRRHVDSWVKIQDLLHPGMSNLIQELINHNKITFLGSTSYNLVMGNNFILDSESAEEFLTFWHKSFDYLMNKYGQTLPYGYRCHICGLESENGIDRWTRVRHDGFMMERVTALFFLSRPDLLAFRVKNHKVVRLKRKLVYKGVGVGFRIFTIVQRLNAKEGKCNHFEYPTRISK